MCLKVTAALLVCKCISQSFHSQCLRGAYFPLLWHPRLIVVLASRVHNKHKQFVSIVCSSNSIVTLLAGPQATWVLGIKTSHMKIPVKAGIGNSNEATHDFLVDDPGGRDCNPWDPSEPMQSVFQQSSQKYNGFFFYYSSFSNEQWYLINADTTMEKFTCH